MPDDRQDHPASHPGRRDAGLDLGQSEDWEDALIPDVGSVFRAPSGLLRVVRHVSGDGSNPAKTWIYFAIRHCSWTGRCYTLYTLAELRRMGYVLIPAKIKRFGAFDQKLNQVCADGLTYDLTCCDVKGIA